MIRTENPESRSPLRPMWSVVAVVLLVAAGLALRVWYGAFLPVPARFWDEQYSLLNIREVAFHHTFEPPSGYYPSPVFNLPPALVLRASHALHEATGDERWRVLEPNGSLAPSGYRFLRWLQGLWGALGALFVFLAGRRLFGPAEGILAALFVAGMPWLVHAGGYLKPDALLVSLVALTAWLTIRALDRPTMLRHAAVGVGVALAASAKLTGALVALPLVAATWLERPGLPAFRSRRRWTLLVTAGVITLVSFVALNPYWRDYLGFLSGLKRDYAMRADAQGMTRLQAPRRVLELLLGPEVFGPLVGGVAIAGCVALVVVALRGGGTERRRRAAVLVVFPVVYALAYVVQTPYFKPNNFLPVVPFLALAAAWVLVGLGRRLVGRPRGTLLVVAASLALVVLVLGTGFRWVYRSIVPSTYDVARDRVATLDPSWGRVVFQEGDAATPPWEGRVGRFAGGLSLLVGVEELAELDRSRLDAADALVFRADRLDGVGAELYGSLRDHHPGGGERIEPRAFERRGPAVVVLRRDRPLLDGPVRVALPACGDGTCPAAPLPTGFGPGELVTAVGLFSDDVATTSESFPVLEAGGARAEWLYVGRPGGGHLALAERFRLVSDEGVRLGAEGYPQERIVLDLYRWGELAPTP